MIFGYGRTSTANQDASIETQRALLKEAGAEKVFLDAGISGAKASRPELDKMLEQLREGDTVVVARLSRLGRSMTDLFALSKRFQEQKVELRSLSENIDTSTPTGRFVFNTMSALSEYQRELIQQNVMEGLAHAREQGRVGGRPTALSEAQREHVRDLRRAGKSVTQIQELVPVGRATIYRALKAAK